MPVFGAAPGADSVESQSKCPLSATKLEYKILACD
jgi:hypothetical protein